VPSRATAHWQHSLSWDELNGLGHEHFEKLPGIIESVDASAVKRVSKQFFRDPFVVRVIREVMVPESAACQAQAMSLVPVS